MVEFLSIAAVAKHFAAGDRHPVTRATGGYTLGLRAQKGD